MSAEGMDLPPETEVHMADSRRRLRQFAEAGGMKMVFPGHVPNSRPALEATEYALREGRGEELHRAIFDLLYGEGRDISDPDVLAEAALQTGLDPVAMLAAVESGEFHDLVESKAAAACELGVHAVPTFVLASGPGPGDRVRIVGAQPYEAFDEAIRLLEGKAAG